MSMLGELILFQISILELTSSSGKCHKALGEFDSRSILYFFVYSNKDHCMPSQGHIQSTQFIDPHKYRVHADQGE